MWRFILVAGLTAAVLLVLWSTWRLDRRLFGLVCAGLVVFGILFGIGAWQGSQQALVTLPHEELAFELENTKALETGLRVNGTLYNRSEEAVAVVTLQVERQLCNATQGCKSQDSTSLVIRRHINPQGAVPVSEVVRLPALAGNQANSVRYLVSIVQARGYKQPTGESGLWRFSE